MKKLSIDAARSL